MTSRLIVKLAALLVIWTAITVISVSSNLLFVGDLYDAYIATFTLIIALIATVTVWCGQELLDRARSTQIVDHQTTAGRVETKPLSKKAVLGLILSPTVSVIAVFGILYLHLQEEYGEFDFEEYAEEIPLPPPMIPMREPVSLDWTVETLEAQKVNLGAKAAGRILFLNFWDPWWPAHVGEMSSIQDLYNDFHGRLEFACISTEPIDTIRKLRDEKGFTFPMYHSDNPLPKELNTEGIPTTFILMPDRTVALKTIGGANWSHATVKDFINDLLNRNTEPVAPADWSR